MFNKSLPHPTTLSKWYQSINGAPEWTQEALNSLKLKANGAEKQNKTVVCNLVFDKISIRKQIEWTGQKKLWDHLELFFGAARSHEGFNNNPTARQFEAAYKRLIVHSEIRASDTGNTINLDATSILFCSSGKLTADENGEDLSQTPGKKTGRRYR